jgi:tetratricopeptide (TPR) repeat protein
VTGKARFSAPAIPAQSHALQVGETDKNQAQKPVDLNRLAARILQRDPRQLPISAADEWSAWNPQDPVPAALRRDLANGMRAHASQDYAASLVFLFAVLEREAEYPPALYQAALCYFRLRRYGDCAALMERFVRVVPAQIGATQMLGHCYYSLGDFELAREHYIQVLAAQSESPEALRGLALSEMRVGNAARALELLDKVIQLRPDHADAHAWRAQILYDEGDSQAALSAAERARFLEPWEPKPWFLLSRILAELDREQDSALARERFENISRVDQQIRQQEGILLHEPARMDVWVQLIALQRSVENRPGVRGNLPRLQAFAPADARTALFLVDSFEWLGERSQAKEAARHAETVLGDDVKSWDWLADFYRRGGDTLGMERAQRQGK